ncbi:MAG: CheB methylesterase domain-containing protein, partial [Bacteroidota bacterium]|nr:CheB methylesterase domain-containing protein [Bacteroidota bacterium]
AEADAQPCSIDIVAIGASAGGTKALQSIFQTLPADFPVPVLVVQHMARGYVRGLARWLADQCPLEFVTAEDGERPRAGVVYIASDDRHLTVGPDHRILLSDDESVNGFKPSIARLFSSVHDAYGAHSAAVLLSGMGNDGAAEMRRLFDADACTIAQDKETSLIHGIPGEAIKLAAARFILPVQEIATALQAVAQRAKDSRQQ